MLVDQQIISLVWYIVGPKALLSPQDVIFIDFLAWSNNHDVEQHYRLKRRSSR